MIAQCLLYYLEGPYTWKEVRNRQSVYWRVFVGEITAVSVRCNSQLRYEETVLGSRERTL